MASPFRTRNAQLFARLEAAWAGTLLASEIFTGFNPTFKPNYDQNEDQSLRSSFGKYPVIAGGVSADLGFSHYVKGSGTPGTAPEFLAAWQMCGLKHTDGANDNTFAPDISQNSPGSVSWNVGGTAGSVAGQHMAIQGAFGNLKISGEAGKLVSATCEFKGAYRAVEDAQPIGSVTYDTATPAPLKSTTVTVLDVASGLQVKSFSIDLGAEITLRPSAKATTAYAGTVYADRKIKGQVVLTAPDLATLDLYAATLSNEQGVFSWAWGPVGNVTTISVPFGVLNSVVPSDQNGRLMLTCDLSASLPGGESEGGDLTIVFS